MSKEYDLSDAKRGPVLKKKGKTRITIYLDNDVIEAYRRIGDERGRGYQTLINRTLRQALTDEHLTEESLRRVIREEMGRYR